MEDILEKILQQLTRIADCYENKESREINENLKKIKQSRVNRSDKKKSTKQKEK
jgi:hypothetical protein|tara:strand:+ start:731 stop:892 length:162 start_codon:yes stop_codon:yes gene_type:complete